MTDQWTILIDEAGGEPDSERGENPILVGENVYCNECKSQHDMEKCPKCGSWIELGYGLMFGGCGVYKYCANDACDWFWKREDNE